MTESRVEQWKRKLLDLSLRNPLLMYGPGTITCCLMNARPMRLV